MEHLDSSPQTGTRARTSSALLQARAVRRQLRAGRLTKPVGDASLCYSGQIVRAGVFQSHPGQAGYPSDLF